MREIELEGLHRRLDEAILPCRVTGEHKKESNPAGTERKTERRLLARPRSKKRRLVIPQPASPWNMDASE